MPTPLDEAEQLHAFFDNSTNGFFAEVGVGGGSRTTLFEVAGWTGVLIEPLPDVAAFLLTARAAKVFAAACVAPDVAGEPLPLRVPSPLASIKSANRSAHRPRTTW